MSSPSASLTLWASSWLAGVSASDDVIDALSEWAPMHLIAAADDRTAGATGLSWPSPRADGVAALLTAVRKHVPRTSADAVIELLLPAPGAVENLPPNSDFARAALVAGQAVVVGHSDTTGLGFVSTVEGPDVLRWTVFSVPITSPYVREYSLGQAEYSMRDAVRGAADALGSMQVLPTRSADGNARARIESAMSEMARHRYPDGTSERVLRVMESADRVAAILSVAQRHAPTEAPTAGAAAAREDLLRPLWGAVRSARLSAVAATVQTCVQRT